MFNDWSHTSPPPIYLRGVVRDSFALCTVIFHGKSTASLVCYKWQPIDGVGGTVRVCYEDVTSCGNIVWAKCRVFKMDDVCIVAVML
jgi:hypothetical protein